MWNDCGQCASCLLLAAAWRVLYCWHQHYGCNPAVDTSVAACCLHQHGVICAVGASTIDVIPMLGQCGTIVASSQDVIWAVGTGASFECYPAVSTSLIACCWHQQKSQGPRQRGGRVESALPRPLCVISLGVNLPCLIGAGDGVCLLSTCVEVVEWAYLNGALVPAVPSRFGCTLAVS